MAGASFGCISGPCGLRSALAVNLCRIFCHLKRLLGLINLEEVWVWNLSLVLFLHHSFGCRFQLQVCSEFSLLFRFFFFRYFEWLLTWNKQSQEGIVQMKMKYFSLWNCLVILFAKFGFYCQRLTVSLLLLFLFLFLFLLIFVCLFLSIFLVCFCFHN